jgi:hypothetical protein
VAKSNSAQIFALACATLCKLVKKWNGLIALKYGALARAAD